MCNIIQNIDEISRETLDRVSLIDKFYEKGASKNYGLEIWGIPI
jgi:hypothetical protein